MNDIDPNKNCHEYCRFGKQCRYLKGENGFDPDECAMYYKIEDIMMDARDIAEEERRSREEYEEDYDDECE